MTRTTDIKKSIPNSVLFAMLALMVLGRRTAIAAEQPMTGSGERSAESFTPARQPSPAKSKVYILLFGGQSNALGWGYQQYLEDTGNPLAKAQSDIELYYDFRGKGLLPENRLLPLQSGNSNTNVKPLPNCYPKLATAPISRFGPELSFARTFRDHIPERDAKLVVIKFALGGSSLWESWRPDGTADAAADGPVYRIFQDVAKRGLAAVREKYSDATISIAGMGWVQGESDAIGGKGAEYHGHLTNFIADVRATFGSNFPFVLAKIAPQQIEGSPNAKMIEQWAVVRAAQDAVAASTPLVAATETAGPAYPVAKGLAEGQYHYTTPALLQIGSDLGNALAEVCRVDRDRHNVTNRAFTGIPSMAVTPGGRLWATWYAGPTPGEDQNNYVVLSTSGDGGTTWQEAFVVDPDAEGPVRAFDPELWMAPDGNLYLLWAQSVGHNGNLSGVWSLKITNPEEEAPQHAPPERWTAGVMMCKPLVLSTGEWVLPASTWRETDKSAKMVVSVDRGKTWIVRGGCNVPKEARSFDEHMFVERKDASLWLLVRTRYGMGESISKDRGVTWPELRPSSIAHTCSRFFITRLQSGNLLLVKHGPVGQDVGRSQLMAFISASDGQSWSGGLLLDERKGVSYPDGQQTADGRIRLIYDFSRTGDRHILMATFREEDAASGKDVSGDVKLRQLVSAGSGGKQKNDGK